MPSPVSVVRAYPVLTNKILGIKVGDALFSDSLTVGAVADVVEIGVA